LPTKTLAPQGEINYSKVVITYTENL
jgi:hypothetical protein